MQAENLPSPRIGKRGMALRFDAARTISQLQIAAAYYPNGKHPDAAGLKAFFDACSAAAAALSVAGSPAPTPTPGARVLAEGDSITQFSPTDGGYDSYARLYKAAHPGLAMTVTAFGGSQLGNPGDVPPANTMYARLASDQAYAPTVVTFMIGANESTGGNYIDRVLAYAKIWRDAGVKVIVGTVLPRAVGANNTTRTAFNAALRAASGTQIDGVFDFDTTPAGADGAGSDTSLYPDGLHPSATAQAQMRRPYETELNWQLGIPNEPLDFAFAPQAAAVANTDVTSAAYTVKGLHAGESRPYSVQSGRSVSKNGGAFVLAGSGTVINGDTLRVQARSSATAAMQVNTTLTVGTTPAIFTVTTAGAGSRDWLPSDLGAKLAMWQRPEDLSGADGSSVVTWPDASGKGNTMTAGAASGGSPKVLANAVNGKKAVSFVGTQQSYLAPPTGLVAGRTSMATFFVAKNEKDPPTQYFGSPASGWGSDGNDYWTFSNGGIYSGYGTNIRRDNMNAPGLLTEWRQFMLQSAPNDWRISQDGADFFTDTSNVVSPGNMPRVGQSPAIASFWEGQLAEFIDLNAAPTTSERQLVEGYLAWKYGLQANLPSAHPYKAAKPTTA